MPLRRQSLTDHLASTNNWQPSQQHNCNTSRETRAVKLAG